MTYLGEELVGQVVAAVKAGDEEALERMAQCLDSLGYYRDNKLVDEPIELRATDLWLAAMVIQRVARALCVPTRKQWERVRAAARAIADVDDQDHATQDAADAIERARVAYAAAETEHDQRKIVERLRLRLARFDLRFGSATYDATEDALSRPKGGAPMRLSLLTRATGALGAKLDRVGNDGRVMNDDGGKEQTRISAALKRARASAAPPPKKKTARPKKTARSKRRKAL